jgi:predicted nucleic acid-binding protein
LSHVRGATAIDAIVAAFAVQRTGIVYTSDVDDFEGLGSFFPALRVFAV